MNQTQNNITSPASNTQAVHNNISAEYAGFWNRLLAMMVDGSILSIFLGIIFVLLATVGVNVPQNVFQIIWIVVQLAYFALLESSTWQGTIGKRLMGLKVTDINGGRISFLRSLGRNLAKFVSAMIFFIGFIMAGFTLKKQGLHDMIAGTLVMKEKPAKTGLVILAIFGPIILLTLLAVIFSSLIFGMLGFGLGSLSKINSNSTSSLVSDINSNDIQNIFDNIATGTSSDATATTKAEYDIAFTKGAAEMDQLDTGSTEPMTTVGPVIIQNYGYNADSTYSLDITTSNIPNLEADGAKVVVKIDSVYLKDGSNIFDAKNLNETDGTNAQLYLTKGETQDVDPLVYYDGKRSINLLESEGISEETFKSLSGTITFTLPATDGVYTKSLPFTIKAN